MRKLFQFIVVALGCLLATMPIEAENRVIKVPVSEDTYAYINSTETPNQTEVNYGNLTTIVIRKNKNNANGSRRGFLKFRIPDDISIADIKKYELALTLDRVAAVNDNHGIIIGYTNIKSWLETTLTWSNSSGYTYTHLSSSETTPSFTVNTGAASGTQYIADISAISSSDHFSDISRNISLYVYGSAGNTINGSQINFFSKENENEEYAPTLILTMKEEQTIDFQLTSTSVQIGEADIVLNATASSNLPVSYESSEPSVATIIEEEGVQKVHIVGTGTTIITALQAGNDNYAAATSVTQTLDVSQTVGLDLTNETNSILVYPSVVGANQLFTISTPTLSTVQIYAVSGVKVSETLLTSEKNDIQAPSQQGVYIVKVKSDIAEKAIQIIVK